MTTASPLVELTALGVSIWLDDLDRHRIDSGGLAQLVDTRCVRGVTTNPSIFEKAISGGAAAYAADLATLSAAGADVDSAIRRLTTDDVRAACDVLHEVWVTSGHVDGRVSIEVDPRLADDTEATIAQARSLWATVDRPNALIKIPATKAGLPAITATIAAGISVNVTLIFAVERYLEVVSAFEEGLHQAAAAGRDLASIHSVASFFVSRVDVEVDARLDALGTDEAAALRGRAAIANARLAWAAHIESLAAPAWRALAEQGAHPQRPLWASTGVKDPAYQDTRYVIDLAVDGCVNTVPEPTLEAVADHGLVLGDTVTGTAIGSAAVWQDLARLGIFESEVCEKLEVEGVAKFINSWESLRSTVARVLDAT
ncbi:MAG: transaldolase [Actinobacteria bacterium]|nr:transaldolase [Actinomycetota bacterium]